MTRDRLFLLLLIVPTAFGLFNAKTVMAQQGQTIEWDFETPVSSFVWSHDTRSSYFTYPLSGGGPVTDTQLGPIGSGPLQFAAMDLFLFATPYTISFDLVMEDIFMSPPPGLRVLTVSSHGQTLFEGEISAGELIANGGPFDLGSYVFRMGAFYAPGPDPLTPGIPGSCCGDVVIDWSLSGTGDWGIDNLVVTAVPEPGTALLLGLGLIGIATRRHAR